MTVYKNLVFKGGGAKIIYSLGVVEELSDRGILSGIERVAGVSSGSTMAFLIALGADVTKIEKFFLESDLTIEKRYTTKHQEAERLVTEYGRYTGKMLETILEDFVEDIAGVRDMTFREMHERGYKDLYVLATELNSGKLVEFSYDKTPDTSVIFAVSASSTYPLYFTPMHGENGEVYVDGGLIDNYPLWLFNEPRFMGDQEGDYNQETLGVHIGPLDSSARLWSMNDILFMAGLFSDMDSAEYTPLIDGIDYCDLKSEVNTMDNILTFISRLIDVGMSAPGAYHHPNFADEIEIDTNFINSSGTKMTTFDLGISQEVRKELVEHGREASQHFFEKQDAHYDDISTQEFGMHYASPAHYDFEIDLLRENDDVAPIYRESSFEGMMNVSDMYTADYYDTVRGYGLEQSAMELYSY